ncbi:hypothetical protein Gotur_019669 [Gossypium turneri]
MEEEFSKKPPHILAKELFNGWHFKPLDSKTPEQYYENILVQTGSTKKEYKKLMAEMLSSLDFEFEDEKSSASSIKMVDLADDTTSVTITRTKKK